MNDLIKALQILAQYTDKKYPTHCEHDEFVVCVNPDLVPAEDIDTLEALGFYADSERECFYSFRYGSA